MIKTIPVEKAVGMVLAHDITEIRPGEFKGRAFKKGHIIQKEDIPHLKRLGKEHIYILEIGPDDMHEDDAVLHMAEALCGEGVKMEGEPSEGRINLIAEYDGLLYIRKDALTRFNMLGEVMCATLHSYTRVKKGQTVAGTRAIPLVIKRSIVEEAVSIARDAGGIISVRKLRKPKAGLVITGNEVYYGRVKDAFEPIIRKKIEHYDGDITGVYFAPDDTEFIKDKIQRLIEAGSDIIITTGGMSVDPDDVTRHAIRDLGVKEMYYGSPVLPGAMFLVAYLQSTEHRIQNTDYAIPILGIPACGMYASVTVFDLILPRILAGEKITRTELSELGHGGMCLKCKECRYPVCPFGK